MGIAYKKFEPTEYVMKVRKGKIVQKGSETGSGRC